MAQPPHGDHINVGSCENSMECHGLLLRAHELRGAGLEFSGVALARTKLGFGSRAELATRLTASRRKRRA